MDNFGTGHLQKIVIFKLLLKPSFARSYMAIECHLQGMRTLNTNRHLAKSVTFEAVVCEVLLYKSNFPAMSVQFFQEQKSTARSWGCCNFDSNLSTILSGMRMKSSIFINGKVYF